LAAAGPPDEARQVVGRRSLRELVPPYILSPSHRPQDFRRHDEYPSIGFSIHHEGGK
jgi:hypothetical protein